MILILTANRDTTRIRLEARDLRDRQARSPEREAKERYRFEPFRFEDAASVREPFRDVARDYDLRAERIGAGSRRLSAQGAALGLDRNERSVPAYVKRLLGRRQEELETSEALALAANEKARIAALRKELDELRRLRAELQVQFSETERAARAGDDKLDPEKGARLQSDMEEKGKRIQRVTEQIARGEDQIASASERADDLMADWLARVADYTPDRWMEVVAGSFNAWADAAGVFDKPFVVLEQVSTRALASVREGLAETTRAVLAGAEDWRKSVEEFGRNFVATMLEMASYKLADGALALLGKIGGALTDAMLGEYFGRYNGTYGEVGTAVGGRVGRAALGGEVRGGVPGRDSSPYLLEPGEVVIRKAAVDAVGLDALLELNARGDAAALAAPPAVALAEAWPEQERGVTRIYRVSPDQVPLRGEKDIVIRMTNDSPRGGSTRMLLHELAH